MSVKQFLPAVLVLVLAACGGTSYNGGEGSGGDSSESSGDGDGKDPPLSLPCLDGCENEAELNRPTPGPRPDCPQTEPSLEDNCQDYDEGLLCTYGDSPQVNCRSRYECQEGKWRLPQQGFFGECDEAEEDFCPQERPEQQSDCILSSAGQALVCGYERHVTCSCYGLGLLGGEPGEPGHWVCNGPPAAEDCPAMIPNLGEGCEEHALQCRYEPSICKGAIYDTVFCFQGAWELGEETGCDI